MRTTRQEWLVRELKDAQFAVVNAQAGALTESAKRNMLIKEALGAGVKQADIARITGLSRERVRQLR